MNILENRKMYLAESNFHNIFLIIGKIYNSSRKIWVKVWIHCFSFRFSVSKCCCLTSPSLIARCISMSYFLSLWLETVKKQIFNELEMKIQMKVEKMCFIQNFTPTQYHAHGCFNDTYTNYISYLLCMIAFLDTCQIYLICSKHRNKSRRYIRVLQIHCASSGCLAHKLLSINCLLLWFFCLDW